MEWSGVLYLARLECVLGVASCQLVHLVAVALVHKVELLFDCRLGKCGVVSCSLM